jgi:hypothetical protein
MTRRIHITVDVENSHEDADPASIARAFLAGRGLQGRLVDAREDIINTQAGVVLPPFDAMYLVTARDGDAPDVGWVFNGPAFVWAHGIYRDRDPWTNGPFVHHYPAEFDRLVFGGECQSYGVIYGDSSDETSILDRLVELRKAAK